MAENNICGACDRLTEKSADFVVNGVTDEVCASLGNNTGFNPSSGHDDCTDLNDANDCMFGNLPDEVDRYDDCWWKPFARDVAENLWNLHKAIICAICGLWSAITDIKVDITQASYMGILTLYTTEKKYGDGSSTQVVPFNKNVLQGNLPEGVLTVKSDYKGIEINNTTNVPLLIDTTFNSSIHTKQRIACCYIVVTRDGVRVGQTPFITPDTYDQQVTAESFILQPNETATMGYSFNVGSRNSWFQSEFGYFDSGSGEPECALDVDDQSDPKNQRSYFAVRAQSLTDIEVR